MAVHGVAVKAHLGVQQPQAAIFQHAEGVDLQHVHVLVGEQLVKFAQDLHAGLDLRALQTQTEGHATAVEILKTRGGIDIKGQDLLGRVMGHVFDVHAAFGGRHDRNPAVFAVDQHGKIELTLNIAAVFDVDAVDLLACRTGLDGDKGAAQHLAGKFSGLTDRAGQAHAAFFASLRLFEMALATTTGMDLRFDNPKRAIQFTRGGFGLFGFGDDTTVGNRDAIAAQKRLGLIFVNIHRTAP